jgi:hypothetical protein
MNRGKDKVTAFGVTAVPAKMPHTQNLLAIYQCRSSNVVWWKVTKVI